MRIALIDDDKTTNFINEKKILKLFPNSVILKFNNGKEAIDYFNINPPFDIALLDLNMPIMNGIEFLDSHRSINEEHKVKKIILFIEQTVTSEFKSKYNIKHVMTKPLSNEKINSILND